MLDALRSVLHFRRFERDPARRRLARCADVSDLRRVAKRRLPHGVFDYIDGGAEAEHTLADNVDAFGRVAFRPRVLRGISGIDTTATVLGERLPVPIVLSPTGFTRIAHPEGERAVARAATRAGLPYTLSTMATCSIEDVAEASGPGTRWFQVYVWRDRDLVSDLIARAKAADYSALVLTVDTALLGRRERDHRRGFTLPPKIGPATVVDGIVHPGWTWEFARAEPITFANVVGRGVGDGTDSAVSLSEQVASQFDPDLSWDDVAWFRERWDGPIVLKGIQTVDDARIAVDHGIEAIALSNHGGRQLDGAPAPFDLLPGVVDAVGGQTEIYCDGGIRRGADVVKAMARGADACMIGRAYLYALGAAGEQGVDWVLDRLADDVHRTLALVGCRSVADLDPTYLGPPEGVEAGLSAGPLRG